MKRKNVFLMVLMILGLWFLSGCNFPGGDATSIPVYPTDTPFPTEIESSMSQSPEIHLTQTYVAASQLTLEEPTVEPILEPTITPTVSCLNHAELVEDVTVPDGTLFSPGETFTKTWRLRNIGTCIWTDQYTIVFIDGSSMGGASPIPLSQVVPQGETIEITVSLIAPEEYGEYRGEWQLQNETGQNFGIGENADTAFDVKINVGETVAGIDLGTPSWEDTFKNINHWYLLETPNTVWSHKKGHLIMKAISSGKRDEWGLATHSPIVDFYMEATFKTGDECEGRDRYGLLIRSTNPNSGYVFSFACDGSYRFYRWDGANYYALQEWKEDSHIITGPDQTNRMGILAEGDTFALYANGELLGEYEDDMFDWGRFGLMVGSGETSNLIVYVEDIAFWEIDD